MVTPLLESLVFCFSSRTSSRARSSVANGFAFVPRLASSPLVATKSSKAESEGPRKSEVMRSSRMPMAEGYAIERTRASGKSRVRRTRSSSEEEQFAQSPTGLRGEMQTLSLAWRRLAQDGRQIHDAKPSESETTCGIVVKAR